MKVYFLTADIKSPSFLKAAQAIQDNGHFFTEEITEADLIIIGPDIKGEVGFIGTHKTEFYVNYNNFLARTFEAY